MSKPFDASSIVRSVFGKNNLEVTFVDSAHRKQLVNLSPKSREQMLQCLLSRSAVTKTDALLEPERILSIHSLKRHRLNNGNPCLELFFGQNMSICITFPPDGLKAFQEALSTFNDPTSWDKTPVQ